MKALRWLLPITLAFGSSSSAFGRDTAGPARAPDPKPPASAPSAPEPSSAPPPTTAPAHSRQPGALASDTLESDSRDVATEQAKQLYALGAEAYAAQRNAEAIRFFQRAAALAPNPKLTYNIALAYDEMRDAGRALAEYRAFLRERPPQAEPDELSRRVTARVLELETSLAQSGVQQVTVLTDPPGATLVIADRAVGVTPWTGELTPGLHRVRMQLPRHRPRELDVAVSREHASDITVALEPELEPEPQTPAPSRFDRITPLTWSFLGVGTAALAGGIAFEMSRASSSDQRARATSPEEAAEAKGAEKAKQMTSLVLLGASAGFLVGGGVLLMLDLAEPEAEPPPATRLALPCTPGFCGLTAQGRF